MPAAQTGRRLLELEGPCVVAKCPGTEAAHPISSEIPTSQRHFED